MNKTCTKCRIEKPISEFHLRSEAGRPPSSRRSTCKKCDLERTKPYLRGFVRKSPRVRRKPVGQAREEYLKRKRERGSRYYREHRDAILAKGKQYRAANPVANAAHMQVTNALNRGDLVRPSHCDHCGDGASKIQAHHDDYSKPLDVAWLCVTCHNTITRHGVLPSLSL